MSQTFRFQPQLVFEIFPKSHRGGRFGPPVQIELRKLHKWSLQLLLLFLLSLSFFWRFIQITWCFTYAVTICSKLIEKHFSANVKRVRAS